MLFEARSHYAHRESPHKPAPPFVSSPRYWFLFLVFGVPCPSLYKLEGRGTCGVQIGLGLAYLLLQAGYKSGT